MKIFAFLLLGFIAPAALAQAPPASQLLVDGVQFKLNGASPLSSFVKLYPERTKNWPAPVHCTDSGRWERWQLGHKYLYLKEIHLACGQGLLALSKLTKDGSDPDYLLADWYSGELVVSRYDERRGNERSQRETLILDIRQGEVMDTCLLQTSIDDPAPQHKTAACKAYSLSP